MGPIDEAMSALSVFRNAILEGPPGTGKSFAVAEIASALPRPLGTGPNGEAADGSGAWAITFHPSTGYEEFVEGIRYNPALVDPVDPESQPRGFELLPGVIRVWIDAAKSQPNNDFLVLIDEINRANVSKVLGDLLLGLEASKRLRHDPLCTRPDGDHNDCWIGKTTTRLAYSNVVLGVPNNLYVLGTMNSSDRSIAPLDSALRRRFAFVRVSPMAGGELETKLGEALPAVGEEVIRRSVGALDNLNAVLRASLGPDSTLGHSYLFELGDAGSSTYWIEVNKGSVATGSQFQVIKQWAAQLLAAVAPGLSIKAKGSSVDLEVEFGGEIFGVKLENPTNKPNTQFSASGIGFKPKMESGGVTLWTPLGRGRLKLEFAPGNGDPAGLVKEYWDRSSAWRSEAGSSRAWGRLDAGALRGDEDERTVWRYSILPQLIDTVTQAYAPELLVPTARENWLRESVSDERTRAEVFGGLTSFDTFLRDHLRLDIVRAGHGLTAGFVIEDYHEIAVAAEESVGSGDGVGDGDDSPTD